jgi:hypothetical protein
MNQCSTCFVGCGDAVLLLKVGEVLQAWLNMQQRLATNSFEAVGSVNNLLVLWDGSTHFVKRYVLGCTVSEGIRYCERQ